MSRARGLALLSLLCASLGGCGDDSSPCFTSVAPAPEVTFIDEIATSPDGTRLGVAYRDGFATSVPIGAKRIVSTLPGVTEIVAHLGASGRLVAVSPHCDAPSEITTLPRVGVMPLDVEAVLALEPDLVIVDRTLFRGQLGVLKSHLPNLLPLETSRTLGALAASTELLAAVIATPEAVAGARAWRDGLTTLEADLARTAPTTPPRVLVVSMWDPLNVLGPGALLDDCIRACGATNVACDLRGPSGAFDEELVLARRPDWILHAREAASFDVATRWAGVPGVAPDRLGSCRTNDLLRGGPRLLEGLRRLGDVLQGRAAVGTLALEPDR